MPCHLTPADIEQRAHAMGLSLAEVCRRAGIAQSTWVRWKAGLSEPRLHVYRALVAATARRRPAKRELV
jgi:predicted transcriptional regulator